MASKREVEKRLAKLQIAAGEVVLSADAHMPLGPGPHSGSWLVSNTAMRELQAALREASQTAIKGGDNG